jgi:alpha-L-rhamnosidase
MMDDTLEFSCSNGRLNALHRNILWGWRGNSVEIPTDCPQRDERLGWLGDAQVFIGTAAYLQYVGGFFAKWLRDLSAEQREDGGVPHVVPDAFGPQLGPRNIAKSGHSAAGWADAAVVCPWIVYLRYGDERLLREQYPSMRAWVEHVRSTARDGLIWDSGFQFGDWVALDAEEGSFFGATPSGFVATAYYAYSAGLLALAAEALGEDRDADEYRDLHGGIRTAFRAEFLSGSGMPIARTQTAYVLSLAMGLVRPEHRDRAAAELADLISGNGGHLTTGFLGTPLICRALSENGRLADAYQLLLRQDYPSWLYPLTKGATTIWEHWDGIKPDGTMWSPAMNSFNHYAYGAVGQWMYETIGGLSPDPQGPGFKSFRIAPRPGGGITCCRVSYNGPYGIITLDWRVEGGEFEMACSIPPNSTATLTLANVDGTSCSGEEAAGGGVAFADAAGGAEAKLGPGTWKIRCPDFSGGPR